MWPVRRKIAALGLGVAFVASPAATPKPALDLSWIRAYAQAPGVAAQIQASNLNNDPRFATLLRSSLPQHQFFWHEHGRFPTVPELVHLFVAVPQGLALVQGRYTVLSGCVPHACSVRGMLWIDTRAVPHPSVIFAATDNVSGASPNAGALIHLWIFTSTTLNWQDLPPSFLASLSAWWTTTSAEWKQYSKEKVFVVSVVQPSGEIVTLCPEVLQLSPK